MKINLSNIVELGKITLIIMLGIFLFRSCKANKEYSSFLEKSLEIMNQQDAMLLDSDKLIYQGQVMIVENNRKINQLLDTIDYLKKPTIITKVKLETKIDTVFVPFETFTEKEIDGAVYIKTPQPFLKIDKWYTVSGTVKNNGVFFDSLTYQNDFYIATGTKDHGSFLKNLFKRNETIVTIKDNNPYSSTKSLQQTVVNGSKKHWHIGPQVGFMLSEKRLVPSVGIGVTYSLIRF